MLLAGLLWGCQSPGDYREEADQVAHDLISRVRGNVVGNDDSITVEPLQTPCAADYSHGRTCP
ncbi:MAG: hypothetical protein HC898_04465 [Phycisphaerales bacterium]|nr:hypothetical protein [Phycisphaerales bacterium]